MKRSLQSLLDGYKTFYAEHFEENPALYRNFVLNGQSPEALVIACSDSRVDPANILMTKPGQLFIIRNVANLVPNYQFQDHACSVTAAMLYAVDVLKVKHVIVFGHTHCGGIQALMKAEEDIDPEHQSIRDWAEVAAEAKQETLKDHPNDSFEQQCHACEQNAIKQSIKNLETYPWIASRLASETIAIHGWLFDLETGHIKRYEPMHDEFLKI